MADVPEVTVTAVAVAVIEGKMDAVSLAVCDLVVTGFHFPDIGHTPGSDDLQIRSQSFDTQLKTDLVVSFTGSAVADSGSALFAGNLYQFLCDSRAGHGSTEEIFVLVYSAGLHAGHDVVIAEVVDDVLDI